MRLLSKELVSSDYRDQLQRDLARAMVCRFLVAYVSVGDVASIGRHLLVRALRDQRSFGVPSGRRSDCCGDTLTSPGLGPVVGGGDAEAVAPAERIARNGNQRETTCLMGPSRVSARGAAHPAKDGGCRALAGPSAR